MREQQTDNWFGQLFGRIFLSIISALLGAIANIVVAPLAPPIQDWETRFWLWLVQDWDGLKHLSWAWIDLGVSLIIAILIGILVFTLVSVRIVSFLSRMRPYFPWREPNPYAGYPRQRRTGGAP